MALTPEDLAQLGAFIDQRITQAVAQAPAGPAVDRASLVGVPEVNPQAGPEYYIHLAGGEVVRSFDSGSTHMAGSDGSTQLVIGRYPVGA
jgi:hypothetical protein